jgi:hypothetical protein
MAVAVREVTDLLGEEQDVDEYLFRWGPPSPLEGGRTYPRWSLLGVSFREVIANPDKTWTVRWSFRPWRLDDAGNPVPHPRYRAGSPGPVPDDVRAELGLPRRTR